MAATSPRQCSGQDHTAKCKSQTNTLNDLVGRHDLVWARCLAPTGVDLNSYIMDAITDSQLIIRMSC